MRRIICLCFLGALACNKKEPTSETVSPRTETTIKIDTATSRATLGADQDSHGCKTSAGYTWSALKGECTRIFETGTQLKPFESDDTQMSAFVIFEDDRAELFIQTEKPLILERKTEGEPFVNGSWQLIPWKGYVLKKDGKIIFTGQ